MNPLERMGFEMHKQWWKWGLLFLAVGLLSPVGAADWPMYRGDATHSAYTQEEIPMPPALLWRFSTDYFEDMTSTPVVAGQTVYFVSKDRLYSLDAQTGSLRWQYPAEGYLEGMVRGTPAVSGGVVYFGDSTGKLYAVRDNGKDGTLLWAYPLESKQAIRSSLTIVDGVIYFGADDNSLYALDIKGEQPQPVWRQPIQVSDDVVLPAVINGDTIYFSSSDQNLYSANLTSGKVRRSYRLPIASNYSQPLLQENNLFIAAGNYIFCLHPRSFAQRWFLQMPNDVTATPIVTADTLYAVCKDKKLYAISTADHKLKWSATLDVTSNSSPIVAGKTIVLGADKGFVYAFDTDTGQLRWRGRTRATKDLEDQYTSFGIMASPVIANGLLYVLPEDGSLNAFSPNALDVQAPVLSDFVPKVGTRISGMPPITISAKIMDEGSGINDSTIIFMLDGQDISRIPEIQSFKRRAKGESGYTLDMEKGMLTYEIPVPKPAVPLKDGIHTLSLRIADWKGNMASAEWSFIVDNRLPTARPKPRTDQNQPGMGGGRSGRGGMGGGMGGMGGGRRGSTNY
ncbi:MAG: PQQ-binding-like beta-propeller repeat protein [Armatimonadetes bacterium]|nr:PQQ-binding-like beta-propeller repeat protein [Armatimonadota bacterium]